MGVIMASRALEVGLVGAVTIVECWESIEHLKAHLTASHMTAFRPNNGHLIESADLRILEEV